MTSPYKMVLVSILSLCIVGAIILFARYIYPKKKINYLLLTILLSIPPIISVFRVGTYESGDFNIHIYRTISFFTSLSEGHFIPSWASGLNANYGYPLFIFNYPLPYYIISLFHVIGASYILSMKLYIALNFILAGIFMYLFCRELFKNQLAAFTATIFFQFAPYHLITMHFKVGIGEIATFTFIPLTFLFFQTILHKKKSIFIALGGLSFALLILSHVVLAFFSGLLLLSYGFINSIYKKTKKIFLISIIISTIGSILSLYVLSVPFLLSKYTTAALSPPQFVYFPKIYELLYAPWRFGFLFQGPNGELSYLLGYSQLFVVIVLFILIFRKKIDSKHKKQILFWFISFLVTIFFITEYSKLFWGIIPFLKVVGSHRLLILAAFIIAILAGYLVLQYKTKRSMIIILVAITIISTILNWGHRRTIPEINDASLHANLGKSTSEGEGHYYAAPKYVNPQHLWFSLLPKNHLEITSGLGGVKELNRTSVEHNYILNANTNLQLRENTVFFPGWRLIDNDQYIPISHDKDGIITFNLTRGLHYIQLKYEDIFIYKLLKVISLIGIITVLSYIAYFCLFVLGFFQRAKYILTIFSQD